MKKAQEKEKMKNEVKIVQGTTQPKQDKQYQDEDEENEIAKAK